MGVTRRNSCTVGEVFLKVWRELYSQALFHRHPLIGYLSFRMASGVLRLQGKGFPQAQTLSILRFALPEEIVTKLFRLRAHGGNRAEGLFEDFVGMGLFMILK